MIALAVVTIGISIGFLSFDSNKTTSVLLVIAVGVAFSILAYNKLRSINKQRIQTDAALHTPEDVSIQQADIIPAGTPPTGNFGLTTGKQILLGPVLLAGGLLVVLV